MSKNYLMKRRRYGYGWIPTTWQGWVFIVLQLGIIITAATFLSIKPAQPSASELVKFFLIFGFAVINLVLISLTTGPRPKWRWGKKELDNPHEDF